MLKKLNYSLWESSKRHFLDFQQLCLPACLPNCETSVVRPPMLNGTWCFGENTSGKQRREAQRFQQAGVQPQDVGRRAKLMTRPGSLACGVVPPVKNGGVCLGCIADAVEVCTHVRGSDLEPSAF